MNNEIQIIGMSNEPLEKMKILQVPSTSQGAQITADCRANTLMES